MLLRLGAGGQPFDVDGDGTISPPETDVSITDDSQRYIQNFSANHTAFSVGANYMVTDGLAMFARVSRGASFNGERKFFSPNIGQFTGLGSDNNSFVDETTQYEGGVKWSEYDAVPGDLDVYVTLFHANTEESNFEITTMRSLDNEYSSTGVETEFSYRNGGFNLLGSFTWTDAEITASATNAANVGHTPRRQADLIYNITPSYTWQGKFTLGANINGTTDTYVDDDNNLIMPGFTVINAFLNVNLTDSTSISLNANNLFDTVGFTEAENGRAFDALTPGDGTNDVIVARSITGRTISFSLTQRF